ncbi:MAG TPA: PAS domain S-box protein [Gemmatimonadaceae bacterium]|nr:PAS domain S-box protein [Gemmatimonadaceae bacterium]
MTATFDVPDRPATDAPLPPELVLVEGLRDALLLLTSDWRISFLNARARRAVEAVGLDPRALVGRELWESFPDFRDSPAAAALHRARAGEGPVHFDHHDAARDRWFEIDAMAAGSGVAVYWRDVTQARRADEARAASEAELRAAHRRLEELVAGAPLAIVVIDNDGNVLMWNPAAEAMFGWTAAELVGQPLPIVPPEERASFEAMRASERSGGSTRAHSTRRLRKDGVLLDVQVSTAPLRDRDGVIVGAIGMLADVSEHRRLEAQLRAAQKMEAVGLLAGGVAHDFNNLLTAIKGFASLLQMVIAPGDEALEFVDEIAKASDRAASLTAQLLAFGRRQLLRPEPTDLNGRVRDLERMLALLVSEGGELRLELDPALGLVHADPGQVEQLILNLAVNARDAIAGRAGGRITIATSNATLRDEFAAWRVAPAPGEYVRLEVRDNGIGMDAATQARIFDPFFTTKPVGHGTGLGLATVYGIAKQSHGYVWVTSAPGEGATFTVYLPRAVERAAVADAEVARGPGATIVLLVEDEDGVRRVACRALELHGFRVIEASNGTQALELAAREPAIALVLTDVMMPEMLGPALAAELRELRRDLPVLYMSGHAEEVARAGLLDPSVPFLAKPFTPAQLVAKVRQVLQSSASR